jgi:hypothetical protein
MMIAEKLEKYFPSMYYTTYRKQVQYELLPTKTTTANESLPFQQW